MASITWNGVTGNWSVAGNWSSNTVPGAGDDVTIDAAGSYNLTVDVAESAHSLALSAASATLEVAANLTVSDGLTQTGGTIEVDAGKTLAASAVSINAGTLTKTTGSGVGDVNAPVTSSGTVTCTSGTLALDAGGTLDGSLGGTGGGIVWLNNGAAFSTDGTVAVVDAGNNDDLAVTNGATWTDGGVINAAGRLVLGNSGGSGELFIAAGNKRFDFTTNDGSIIDGGGAKLINFGILAKTAGTGVSSVIGMTNNGTVDAASGTLKLTGIAGGSGTLEIEAHDTLELFDGSAAGNNIVVFNGPGATLRIDTSTHFSS
jgi:hypothetical protein